MRKAVFFLDGTFAVVFLKFLDIFTPDRQPYHGVFETMLVLDGQVNDLNEHLTRVQRGLKALRIRPPCTPARFKLIVSKVVKENSWIKCGRLRLMVFKEGTEVHCACMILPYVPYNEQQYREGLKAVVIATDRPATARLAHVKSLDHGVYARALQEAKERGYDEAILLNKRGEVMETARGNIFVHDGSGWITPPLSSGCLAGITRGKFLGLARRLGIKVREKKTNIEMLKGAKRVVMANSLLGMIRLRTDVGQMGKNRLTSGFITFH